MTLCLKGLQRLHSEVREGGEAGRLVQEALDEAEDDHPVVEQEHHSHKGEALQ